MKARVELTYDTRRHHLQHDTAHGTVNARVWWRANRSVSLVMKLYSQRNYVWTKLR